MASDRLTTMFRFAAMTVCALFRAAMVRSMTVELNRSVGRVWPFSLVRCATPDTPGCRFDERSVLSDAGQHSIRVGTGAWWSVPPA